MTTIATTRPASRTFTLTVEQVSAFHPKNGARYSPNLHAFLTAPRNKSLTVRARVFRDAESRLWLGYRDDLGNFIGARMSQVLCYGAKAEVFCHLHRDALNEIENFWQQYAEDGRCALDREHVTAYVGSDTRWSQQGDTRQCLWCGKASQRLVRTERVEVVKEERWTNV